MKSIVQHLMLSPLVHNFPVQLLNSGTYHSREAASGALIAFITIIPLSGHIHPETQVDCFYLS
jgi:hypothetical protein